jgi:hypothetical protein
LTSTKFNVAALGCAPSISVRNVPSGSRIWSRPGAATAAREKGPTPGMPLAGA